MPGQWRCSRTETGRLDLQHKGLQLESVPGARGQPSNLRSLCPGRWGGGPGAATSQCSPPPECVLPSVLPAAVLASGHCRINSPSAVPTREGAQPGEPALPIGLSWEGCRGPGQGPQTRLLALSSLFASCRNQGRSHCAGPAPQAPSQPPGALARASPTHAAALEGGSRPRWARQFRTRCVETASLGEPWGGARGFTQDLRSWGLSLTPPLSGPQTSHV